MASPIDNENQINDLRRELERQRACMDVLMETCDDLYCDVQFLKDRLKEIETSDWRSG